MTDLNGHRLELVDCPEDAQFFKIGNRGGEKYLSYDKGYNLMGNWNYIQLPPGNYTLIGKGNEITEEQWEKLVERVGCGYRNYLVGEWNDESEVAYAKESGLSWIRSQGKEPSKTILLLIK